MIVNVFNDAIWAFWVGMTLAIIGASIYVFQVYLDRMNNKIVHGTKSTNNDTTGANTTTETTEEQKQEENN
jgi:hypothetical protein